MVFGCHPVQFFGRHVGVIHLFGFERFHELAHQIALGILLDEHAIDFGVAVDGFDDGSDAENLIVFFHGPKVKKNHPLRSGFRFKWIF